MLCKMSKFSRLFTLVAASSLAWTSVGGWSAQNPADAAPRAGDTYQPDGMIKQAATTPYLGRNVYNTTGQQQTALAAPVVGSVARFVIRVQNDGAQSDTIFVQGCKSGSRFTVSYFSDGNDVSTKVEAGTFHYTETPKGFGGTFLAHVTVTNLAIHRCRITATSKGDPSREDVVVALVESVPPPT